MKNIAYISVVLLILISACQKDFYLEDLDEINSQIEKLQTQISNSRTKGNLLQTEKEVLESELQAIQIQLNQQLMTYEEALTQIQNLEQKIIDLKGVKNGIYEVVLEKRITATDEGVQNQRPWRLSDPNRSEFIELKDLQIVRYTTIRYYAIAKSIENNEYDFYETRKIFNNDGSYYSDLSTIDTTQEPWYKVNVSKQRISLDTLLFIEKERGYYLEDADGVSKPYYTKVYKKYVDRNSFPPIKTEYELTDIFKNTKSGFYSDSLYLTLDPSDPLDYVRVFIEDAKRHGVDLSHITNKEPYFEFFEDEQTIFGACAWASDVCDREKIWIEYFSPCWESGLPSPYFADRLKTMYHELGHSILSYDHPMVEDWEEKGLEWPENVAEGFNGSKDDIMGYGNNSYWEHEEDLEQTWYQRLDRFFKGTDHEYYDCTTSKGRRIIVD